jgi:hypothetical protein
MRYAVWRYVCDVYFCLYFFFIVIIVITKQDVGIDVDMLNYLYFDKSTVAEFKKNSIGIYED